MDWKELPRHRSIPLRQQRNIGSLCASGSRSQRHLENHDATPRIVLQRLELSVRFIVKKGESQVTIDATGFSAKTYARWFDPLRRSGSRKEWLKLHAAVTCVLKAIPSMEVTSGEVHDSTQLAGLLDSLPLDDIEAVSADAGYLSRRNCDLIEAKGAKPYIKIKKNIKVIRSFGSRAWVNMILDWRRDPKAWNKTYNMRSSAECAFSAIKRSSVTS